LNFYKWDIRDFREVLAHRLKKGDEIAYGQGSARKYGAIPIKHVTNVEEKATVLVSMLPIGANIQSDPTIEITISWKGTTPNIRIQQMIEFDAPILIRRK
jgi:hypothetical protein